MKHPRQAFTINISKPSPQGGLSWFGWIVCNLAFFVGLALWASVAHAQSSSPITPDQLMNAANNGGNDASIKIFTGALGSFFTNPLSTVGGSSTVLGSMFVIFNGAIFCISVLWGSYGVGRGILTSAHEGQVLGQRMSAVWMPIRMVTGLVGSVPIFGGYNGFQVLVVLSATMGIGMANMMWSGAISAASQFQGVVSPVVATNPKGASMREAAYGIFQTEVCRQAVDKQQQDADVVSLVDKQMQRHVYGSLVDFQFGSAYYPARCGGVAILPVGSGRSSSSAFGFRVASVDYEAVTEQVKAAYVSKFPAFQAKVSQLATTWINAREAALQSGEDVPPVPSEELEAASTAFATSMSGDMSNATSQTRSAITDSAMQTMRAEGWSSAGAWFATFAEANSALNDAVHAFAVQVLDPQEGTFDRNSQVADALKAVRQGIRKQADQSASSSTPQNDEGGSFAPIKKWIATKLGWETPTGNWSMGQAILMNSSFGLGVGAEDGAVNPVIMFKNMGDYLMVVGEACYGAVAAFKVSGVGKAVEAVGDSSLAKSIPGVSQVSNAASLVSGLLSVLMMVAGAFLLIGTVMSVYIPLVPYLTWMGALVQYFVVVVEGLVAAAIGALSHMEAEGDGMGQRTERFYIFLLNALARPALMLLGFFMASALVVLVGAFQFKMFASAIANSQGNSLTGVVSLVGLLIIFLISMWTLIQALFNMIHLLPDQVLGYMGAGHTSELGRDQEGKIHGMFVNFSRGAGAAMGGMLGAGKAPGKDKPKGGGASGGGKKGAPRDTPV